MASQPIYQFYAELDDYKPKIWRRFQVMNNITVAKLGYILMTMFEMQASHLFCFDVPYKENFRNELLGRYSEEEIEKLFGDSEIIRRDGSIRRYEVADEELEIFDDEKSIEASDTLIKHMLSHKGACAIFNYDYGDNWNIQLLLEDIIEDKALPGKELPRVLEGKGYGIIEDCGGTPGLTELAKAFKRKKGEEYETFREWLGVDSLDLDTFDMADANFRLKKVPRIYADIYEHHIGPTRQSLDLLERKYLHK